MQRPGGFTRPDLWPGWEGPACTEMAPERNSMASAIPAGTRSLVLGSHRTPIPGDSPEPSRMIRTPVALHRTPVVLHHIRVALHHIPVGIRRTLVGILRIPVGFQRHTWSRTSCRRGSRRTPGWRPSSAFRHRPVGNSTERSLRNTRDRTRHTPVAVRRHTRLPNTPVPHSTNRSLENGGSRHPPQSPASPPQSPRPQRPIALSFAS